MDHTLPIMTREIARTLEELDASLDPAAPDAGGLRLQAERFTDLMIDALFPRFAFDRTSRESRLLQAAGVLEDCLSHIPSAPSLETVFPSLLVTGPFSIILGFNGGLMALNYRLKLRSMVVGEQDDMVYIASEEAAIRVMAPEIQKIWSPAGGEPVIVRVKEGAF